MPEESNEKTGTSGLTSMVNIGEKTKRIKVFAPIKLAARTNLSGKQRYKTSDKLTAKYVSKTPGTSALSRFDISEASQTNGSTAHNDGLKNEQNPTEVRLKTAPARK